MDHVRIKPIQANQERRPIYQNDLGGFQPEKCAHRTSGRKNGKPLQGKVKIET
jgi:hypothetical protein